MSYVKSVTSYIRDISLYDDEIIHWAKEWLKAILILGAFILGGICGNAGPGGAALVTLVTWILAVGWCVIVSTYEIKTLDVGRFAPSDGFILVAHGCLLLIEVIWFVSDARFSTVTSVEALAYWKPYLFKVSIYITLLAGLFSAIEAWWCYHHLDT